MFDIHKVKPVHGWREFVGEVGIIVLGILLALAAEQLIERAHWAHEVEHTHETIRADLTDVLETTREREAEDGCIRRRLDYLAGLLANGGGRLPALGHIGAPALRTWQLSSWPAAVSSQVTTHLDRDEVVTLANLEAAGGQADQSNQRELDDWAGLFAMVGPARTLDTGEAASLRRLIADAAYRANLLRLDAYQTENQIVRSGLLTKEDVREADRKLRVVLAGPNRRSLCGPISAPTGVGADAPYDPAVQPDPLHGIQQASPTVAGPVAR